jgi:hypothetical protein
MPGVGGAGVPSLSEIVNWDTTHLVDAATHFTSAAQQWENHFTTIHELTLAPGGTPWEGRAADAAQLRTYADLITVRGVADNLYRAASVARDGADGLDFARNNALDAVRAAQAEGFDVGEDLSVATRAGVGSPALQGLRRGQAQVHAADIIARAADLRTLDQQVAGRLTAATAPLSELAFHEPDADGRIQAVDYHRFKEGPDQPPVPPGPNAADIRSVLDQLPIGSQTWIREVRSPEDLQKLLKWSTQDGTEVPGRYPDPSIGIWRDLPDGSKIGERYAAKSTGDASLDINLNGQKWKVHINPQTGGQPNIPAPGAAPAVPEPPLSAPPPGPARVAAPVEPAPALNPAPPSARVPIEGWGGPSAEPFGPKLIHPPGSINHPFPILGEDDPAENPRDFMGH